MLMAADGSTNREIDELVDLHYNQVGLWSKRYEEYGLAGLDDQERSGRPCVYDHDDVPSLALWTRLSIGVVVPAGGSLDALVLPVRG